jgi:hypothetical protein
MLIKLVNISIFQAYKLRHSCVIVLFLNVDLVKKGAFGILEVDHATASKVKVKLSLCLTN